jgi:hypothetical protein
VSLNYSWECGQGLEIRIKELTDEIKLLRANRWAAFEDYELRVLADYLVGNANCGPTRDVMLQQVYAELTRRAELERRTAESNEPRPPL